MRSIGLLLPEPLEQLQPFATVFVNALRTLFYNNGFRLDTHIGHRYFSGRPSVALKRLVARFPCEGWILAFSNRASQAWFDARRIPAVVIGTAYEGISLPFVDIDMLATARHAAGVLLRKGHRRMALIIEESARPGDIKTQQGFLEGLGRSGGAAASGQIFKHGGTVPGLQRLVERILQMPERPTALFIANPYHYLAVAGILAEKGLHVPRDMSLLCRDDDYCLRYLPTAPSRYVYSATLRAKEIFSTLMWARQHRVRGSEPVKTVLILPEFFAGGSIATLNRE
jgi:DNA-binding LacI/PurR family transcriptional regulator